MNIDKAEIDIEKSAKNYFKILRLPVQWIEIRKKLILLTIFIWNVFITHYLIVILYTNK